MMLGNHFGSSRCLAQTIGLEPCQLNGGLWRRVRTALLPFPRMPTIRFSLFGLFLILVALTFVPDARKRRRWSFGGGPEAPHGAAARRGKAAAGGRGTNNGTDELGHSKQDTHTQTYTHKHTEKGQKKEKTTTQQKPGAGHETLEFTCASRAGDAPLSQDGAPVQYIHVPKAGGTTIQALLLEMGERLHFKVSSSDHDSGYCKTIQGSFGKGQVYMGHTPIGWCFAESPVRPLYIISLREPISQMVSHYDYYATQTGTTDHEGAPLRPGAIKANAYLRGQEKKMEKRGIPSTKFLENLFLANDNHVMAMVVSKTQMRYLLPGKCSAQRLDPRSRLSIALKNVLRSDIVVDSDLLSDQLLPQLWYHAPQTRYLERIEQANGRKRSKQILSNATAAKMLKRRGPVIDGVDADSFLYDFGKRVARARADRARACWGSTAGMAVGRGGVNCSALCTIGVTATELDLIRSPSPKQCSSDSLTTPSR